MLIILAVVSSYSLTAPAAYVSRIHSRAQDATALCLEIPHSDDDYLNTLVDPITGAPNEFSQVSQWTFVATWFTPIEKPESSLLNPTYARKVQTRALTRTYWSPSKMRGR
jgi:hypothetical protein